ncbi:type I-E CRISPR-associated protein Cas5/CasD [Desulfonema ishimotonii]|uniref:Type I-E CRISPR-associated protein Cas5/CasD n=1 Tax=Desulfonema ishimotonii TaxID=45657 RepID=A0A401FWX8_9BACT|nr:type I-E CRISPR-associated protein Cas5/CasD [Desulfonema ishimotonii]GBC61449.1 type I-E CRISPR-associated protein Cas5/CasD [Desulfonema ishimotonii]
MTQYLLMPIAAPMQSWGDMVVSGDDRPSLPFPTHSGLAGMICAALGIDRKDGEQLRQVHDYLCFVVAQVNAGAMWHDFYTVRNVVRATGGTDGAIVGRKFYLADALFLVAVSAGQACPYTLKQIGHALLFPRFALYAGRRAYPLSLPPVCLENSAARMAECENPVREMGTLLRNEETRRGLFYHHPLADQPVSELRFYVESGEAGAFGLSGDVPLIPHTVRDRYHGRYRSWGYREFDERDVLCIHFPTEE